jgi:hypothetical protein
MAMSESFEDPIQRAVYASALPANQVMGEQS